VLRGTRARDAEPWVAKKKSRLFTEKAALTKKRKNNNGQPKRGIPFSVGDAVRIPAGLIFIYLSIIAIKKAIGAFAGEPISAIVTGLGLLVGLLFIGIGLAMVFGSFFSGSRR